MAEIIFYPSTEDEPLAPNALGASNTVTPVLSHRTVSLLPDSDYNQLSPEVAQAVQTAIEELSRQLMERATLGALLVEPGYRQTSVGYTLTEVSFVPGVGR